MQGCRVTISRAVLLVGSAKPGGTSTSESIGAYLMTRLERRGVATTVRHVGRSHTPRAIDSLLVSLLEADLIVLATPLYVDSLPYLVTRTCERLLRERRTAPGALAAIVNCGFPEASQCNTALAILRCFAARAGLEWAGGLAVGGGATLDGCALADAGPIFRRLRESLEESAGALAHGQPIPMRAVALASQPIVPARVYTAMGRLGWYKRAARNGVLLRLGARPYKW